MLQRVRTWSLTAHQYTSIRIRHANMSPSIYFIHTRPQFREREKHADRSLKTVPIIHTSAKISSVWPSWPTWALASRVVIVSEAVPPNFLRVIWPFDKRSVLQPIEVQSTLDGLVSVSGAPSYFPGHYLLWKGDLYTNKVRTRCCLKLIRNRMR